MIRSARILAAALVAAAASAKAGADDVAVLAEACFGCHASEGGDAIPAIAGRDEDTLASLLLAYRADSRQGTIMNRLAKGYTEDELRALAAYFADFSE